MMNSINSFRRLLLVVTESCNFDCDYCYVLKSKKDMSYGTAKKALDDFMHGSVKDKEVIFIGGEPLMKYDIIKKLILYSKSRDYEVKFGFPTNGSLLTQEILEFFSEEKVHVSLSVDGPEEINDSHRINDKKRDLSSILGLCKHYKNVGIRMTVSPDFSNKMFNNFKFFFNLGFDKVNLQPVQKVFWGKEKIISYLNELNKIIVFAKNNKVKMSILDDCFSEDNAVKRCPMGNFEVCVGPDGAIYACQIYLSFKEDNRDWLKIGDLDKGIDKMKLDKFSYYKICEKENIHCKKCNPSELCTKICLLYGFNGEKDLKIYRSNRVFQGKVQELVKLHMS